MARLRFSLFGGFTVERGGRPLSTREWRSRQNRGILKVLITHRGNIVSSDQLIEIFWPDQDPAITRQRLHVRISQLRRAIDASNPSAYILTTQGGYCFNPNSDCWIDVNEFEKLVDKGRRSLENGDLPGAIQAFEQAADLYRGDFLQDDLYEDWAMMERERLRESFLSILSELAESYAHLGRYQRAISYCQKILSVDACREAIYVQLMLYYYCSGEHAVALRIFDRCRQVLQEELGVQPLPETIALADQIRCGALLTADGIHQYQTPPLIGRIFEVPFSLGRPPFVGREREYAWLVHHWKTMQVGLILIEGEAGIGKTRLVNEFIVYAETCGKIILQSRSSVRETSPYAPIIAAFQTHSSSFVDIKLPESVLSRLIAFFPEFAERLPKVPHTFPTSTKVERSYICTALASLLEQAFPSGATLFVDDAQHLNQTSMEMLDFLSDTMVVILCCRSEETPVEHNLRRLMIEKRKLGHAVSLNLGKLSSNEISELIRQMASRELGEFSGLVAEKTQGNPLFLVATLQHLFEEGRLFIDHQGRWDLSGGTALTIAPEIRKIIESRLRRFDQNQRLTFDLAAVIGRDFDFPLIQHAGQIPEDLLLDALNGLIQAALLIEPRQTGRGEFAPTHELYTQVAYETLPVVRRRLLHLHVAEALSDLHGDEAEASAEIAHHYYLGEMPEKAIHYAVQAGKYALRLYAGKEAIRHFNDALEWTSKFGLSLETSIMVEIHHNLGEALRRSGCYKEAIQHFQQALIHAENEVQQDIAFQFFSTEVVRGANLAEFIKLIQPLEDKLTSGGDSWGLVGLFWYKGYLSTIQAQAGKARSALSTGWRMAQRLTAGGCSPPEWLLAKGYLGLSRSHEFWADWSRSVHFASKAQDLYTKQEDYFGILNSRSTLGVSFYGLGLYDQALSHLDRCIEMAVQADDPGTLGEVLFRAGLVHLERGDWEKVERFAMRTIDVAQSVGDVLRQGLGSLLLARLNIRRGEPEQAISGLQVLVTMARSSFLIYLPVLFRPLAEAHFQTGDYASAQQVALEGLDLAAQSGFKREWGDFQRILGDCLVRTGSFSQAKEHLQQALVMAQRIGCRFDQAEAHLSLGRMYLGMDKMTDAENHQKEARDLFTDLGIKQVVLLVCCKVGLL